MSELPPLPPGFALDTPQVPALPPGFTLDEQPSVLSDVGKSVAVAPVKGLIAGAGFPGDVGNVAHRAADYLGVPEGVTNAIGSAIGATKLGRIFKGPSSAQLQSGIESATGPIYQSQTPYGRYAAAPLETAANPVSYIGPGALPFKLGAAALSGVGSEAGGDIGSAVGGQPGRVIGQLGGGLAGGSAAVKSMGPRAIEAAIPTAKELQIAARTGGQTGGYTGALMSGLELDPAQVAPVAYGIEQRLAARGFTGGPNGTAKGTLSDIQSLQSPPAGSTITAANLDTLRATLGRRASEVVTDARGVTKPTSDAAAAQQALADLKNYTENIPASHVVAGDPQAYNNAIKEANANFAAYKRAEASGQRINAANLRYESKPNVTLGSQLKNQFRPMLEKDYRTAGFTDAEKAQLRNINSAGGKVVDLLGSRSIPAMTVHALLGVPTLGMSVPVSIAANYGARKLGSALTSRQANKLDEMLRKRSPEFEQRQAALPPQPDLTANKAALARALLTAGMQ